MAVGYTAGNVMDLAASLLNDTAKNMYTYLVQLPYLRSAADDLDIELQAEGLPIQIAVCEVPANVGDEILTLPCSFFLPLRLEERPQVSTNDDDFVDMVERQVEPAGKATQNIDQWAFRNNQIYLFPFTQNKTVRVTFRRSLVTLADDTTVGEVRKAKNFLAFRTAALCAEFIGGNKTRADSLNIQGMVYVDKLVAAMIKNTQGTRVRRRPFRMGTSRPNLVVR